jgi:hypothetical protein
MSVVACGKKKSKKKNEDPPPVDTTAVEESKDIVSIEVTSPFISSQREKSGLGFSYRIDFGPVSLVSSSEDMSEFEPIERTATKLQFVQQSSNLCELQMPKPVFSRDHIYFETSDSEDCSKLLTTIDLSNDPKFVFSNLQGDNSDRPIRTLLLSLKK